MDDVNEGIVEKVSLNRTSLLTPLIGLSFEGLKVTKELLGCFLIVPPSGESQLNPLSTEAALFIELDPDEVDGEGERGGTLKLLPELDLLE